MLFEKKIEKNSNTHRGKLFLRCPLNGSTKKIRLNGTPQPMKFLYRLFLFSNKYIVFGRMYYL